MGNGISKRCFEVPGVVEGGQWRDDLPSPVLAAVVGELRLDDHLVASADRDAVQAGLWLYPKTPATWPPPGDRGLFGFPPPYHPLELLAANRGWSGLLDGRPAADLIPQLAAVTAFRTAGTFQQACRGLLPWFEGWSLARLLLLAHLFTPTTTEGDEWTSRIVTDRRGVWQALLGPGGGRRADEVVAEVTRSAHGRYIEFWKTIRANGGYDL